MDIKVKTYIAGHTGMVGSAIARKLRAMGCDNIVARTHAELDLCDQAAVEEFFRKEKPEHVYLAAGKVGGIVANETYPADFIRITLQIQTNVIDAAYKHGCKKLLFIGSTCIYPKHCPQPIKEEYLLGGPLEPTNEGFAVAKIAGVKMCQTYRRQYGFDAISLMPGNLYGPGDNFHPVDSHVIPAMLRRFHEAKTANAPHMAIWGTGKPLREFLHVDDLADACVFLMRRYSGEDPINIGPGVELSTMELAKRIAAAVGYQGEITTDVSKPDGTPRKYLDVSRIAGLGWKPVKDFDAGLAELYAWYIEQKAKGHIRE